MSRMNRRRFTWVATSGIASAALVACGGDAVDEDLTPTQIPDAAGAPPTLAPQATPFSSEDAGGDEGAEEVVASTDQGGGSAIELEAQDPFNWSMYEFEAAPGQDIHVVNVGNLQHNFVVDEWGIETPLLNNGEEATVTVPDDAEVGSEVVFYCSVPGHREGGMEGTITVVEAGAAAAEEEAPAEEEGAAAAGGGGAIELEAQDPFNWSMYEFEAAPGQDIHIVNAGNLQHNFVVDEWGAESEMLNGGDEDTVTVPEDAEVSSEVVFYCAVPGHREGGMEGTITVVEGGGGAAVAEEEVPEEASEESGGEEEAAAVAGGAGEVITVNALDALQFDPSSFEVVPGQEIHVINAGVLQHDFVVDELDFATDMLNGGDEQTITVPEDAEPGDYIFYCSVPGHQTGGMEGTMTVTAGGGAAASEESEETAGASDEAAAASASGGSITVEALDSLQFEPAEFSIAPGQTIHVINLGTLQHDFVVDEWGLATRLLNRDEEETLTVPANAEVGSEIIFYCSVPGHQTAGMEGRLTVVEGDGSGAPAEEAPAESEEAPAEATPEEAASSLDLDENAIRVSALDSMKFAPSHFSAAPGQQIHLVNPGVLVHDIVVDEWGLDSGELGGGDETTFRIPEDAEIGSEHEFYCSVPGHYESGMTGIITIIESEFAAAATPVPEATPAG